MCTRITCRTCGKPSFSGCGAHVEMVLADVPRDKRCKCRESNQKVSSSQSTAASWWPFGKKDA